MHYSNTEVRNCGPRVVGKKHINHLIKMVLLRFIKEPEYENRNVGSTKKNINIKVNLKKVKE